MITHLTATARKLARIGSSACAGLNIVRVRWLRLARRGLGAQPLALRYRQLADGCPQILWTADLRGRVDYTNERWREFVCGPRSSPEDGRRPATPATDLDWAARVHPDDYARARASWRASVEQRVDYECEYRCLRFDGVYRWCLSRAQIVRDDERGAVGWVGSMTDIHVRRRAEAAQKFLGDASRALSASLESEDILRGVVSAAVPQFCDVCEVYFAGSATLSASDSSYVDGAAQIFASGQEDRSTQLIGLPLRRGGHIVGALVMTLSSVDRVFDEEDLRTARELTQRLDLALQNVELHRCLREAKQTADDANQAKTAFLANVSHEIRTPLSAMVGFADMLFETEASGEDRLEPLRGIKRNGELMSRLINDLLDLSKVEAGQLDVESLPVSLDDLLRDLNLLFAARARQRGVLFCVEAEAHVPAHFNSDPTRLRQALYNIVGNALKFTSQGSITVRVSCEPRSDGPQLHFEIRDTGIGVDPQLQPRLFRAFSQAEGSTSRRFGGTGLGLVIARRLARALGGDLVLLSSALNEGSCFRLSVRAVSPQALGATPFGAPDGAALCSPDGVAPASPNAAHPSEPAVTGPARETRLTGAHILVVDDTSDTRYLVGRILRREGAQVEMASDGIEAVEKALASPFDLILMDLQMPRSDGFEALSKLRQSGCPTPVIAFTAQALTSQRRETMRAGFCDHLSKPITFAELIDKVAPYAPHPSSALSSGRPPSHAPSPPPTGKGLDAPPPLC